MQASRDQNFVPSALGVSSADSVTTLAFTIDPLTGRLLVDVATGVTSITAGTGLTSSPNPIISTGTISLSTALQPLASLTGNSLKVLRVNAGETAVEYATVSSGITIGTTTITSGTTTRILYDNAGVVGEYVVSGTGNVAMTTSPVFTTPNIGIATGSASLNLLLTGGTLTGNLLFTDNTYDIGASGATRPRNYFGSGNLQAGSSGEFNFNSRTSMSSGADGNLRLTNNAGSDFGRIQLGGTTSSFPSIKRVLATVAFRLADDSADASITAAGATFSSTVALGANSLTMTGSLAATGARVTKGWFTDLESTNMPTVGGTAILTSLTAPQFTTIELGAASDTTLARVSAGVVSIEGVTIDTASNTLSLTNKTISGSTNILGGVTMTLGSDADGDTYYRASNVLTRLPKGTGLQQLRMNAGATAPEWFTASGGGASTATGAYTGDAAFNRAIAHGLGATPKQVFIFDDTNRTPGNAFQINGNSPTGLNSVGSTNYHQTVTTMDATNFYVSNGSDTAVNFSGDSYHWFAIS